MKRETLSFKRLVQYTHAHKIKIIIVGLGILFVVVYSFVFFIPKPIQFSYAGTTCADQITLLPGIHRADHEDKFQVSFKNQAKLGSFAIASTRTCFSPVVEPKVGTLNIGTSLFGSIIARKNFIVRVSAAPSVSAANLEKPLPVSRPLIIPLSEPDSVFQYRLEKENMGVECKNMHDDLSCDVPSLNLKQGKKYSLALMRQFQQGPKTVVTKKTVETLKAVTIKKASLKNKQTVYSKPKSFTFTTDKPLIEAKANLKTIEKKPKTIEIKTELKGNVLRVDLSKQLPRETKYRLTLESVEAQDGSTLVEPKKLDFTMSGGPKVTAVNIGKNRVSSSAVVTVQFDQKISTNVDIKKYVSLSGGGATITKSASSVSIALQNLPRCKVFSLRVASGLPSKYDIRSKNDWNYSSRTLCHTVTTYGASIQGRPLNAYIFGSSGPVTMYTGAIHGNEASSSGLMKAWIEELENNPSKIGNRRIVVIPTINPDGLAANTRNNSRDVNLSRNFPTDNWTKDINDTDGHNKGGGGTKPLSEPEAKALAAITQQYRPRLLLSFHAIGSLVVGDPGGYSASYAAKYASMVGYRNATGEGGTFDYDITGAYEDWSYRNEGIPSMVIELGSYGYYSIDHHRAALWAML